MGPASARLGPETHEVVIGPDQRLSLVDPGVPAAASSRGHSTLSLGLHVVLQAEQLDQFPDFRRRELRWSQKP